MKHPDISFVQSVLNGILSKRRLADWKVSDIRFVFFPSHYEVEFESKGVRKRISIITELFDAVAANDSILNRKKIKAIIRHNLTPEDPDDN